MFVRCERCRAVYEFQATAGEPASLRCARCGHTFRAPDTGARLRPQGTLGGAAALAYAPDRWREVAVRAPAPLKSSVPPVARSANRSSPQPSARASSMRPLAIILGVVAFIGVGAGITLAALHRSHATAQALPQAAAAKVDTARKLLALDDLASLEQAVATFDDASTLAPGQPGPQAWRSVATTLLGVSLKVEAAELTSALQMTDRHAKRLQRMQPPAEPAEIEQFATRASDLRQRIQPATQRADKLLREGAELARNLAKTAGNDDPDVLRAQVIAAAAAQDVDRIALLTKDRDETEFDGWIAYARGLSRALGNISAQKAQEARTALEATLQRDPSIVRAKWDLARLALVSRPPDFDRATGLFTELLAASPAHEGAKRGADTIALLKLAAADQQAEAQAGDGP